MDEVIRKLLEDLVALDNGCVSVDGVPSSIFDRARDLLEESNEIQEAESKWLDDLRAHTNKCTTCRKHRGHMPIGFCVEGLRLYNTIP